MSNEHAWVQTFTGVALWPENPEPSDICIEDVAHHLAHQSRFSGSLRLRYSTAQHSVLVSQLCDRGDALWGLLHDAAEAYLVDLPWPVKRFMDVGDLIGIEKGVQWAVCARFSLPMDEPASVKRADMTMAAIEARDLQTPIQDRFKQLRDDRWRDWFALIGDCPIRIDRTWGPDEAKERFLARFHELTTNSDLGAAARLMAGARRKGRSLIDRARGLFDGEAA